MLASENKPDFIGDGGENSAYLLQMVFPTSISNSKSPFLSAGGPPIGTGLPGVSCINLAGRSPIAQEIGPSGCGSSFPSEMCPAGFEQLSLRGQPATLIALVFDVEMPLSWKLQLFYLEAHPGYLHLQ